MLFSISIMVRAVHGYKFVVCKDQKPTNQTKTTDFFWLIRKRVLFKKLARKNVQAVHIQLKYKSENLQPKNKGSWEIWQLSVPARLCPQICTHSSQPTLGWKIPHKSLLPQFQQSHSRFQHNPNSLKSLREEAQHWERQWAVNKKMREHLSTETQATHVHDCNALLGHVIESMQHACRIVRWACA